MSALHLKADMCSALAHVCLGPNADTPTDIAAAGNGYRYRPFRRLCVFSTIWSILKLAAVV